MRKKWVVMASVRSPKGRFKMEVYILPCALIICSVFGEALTCQGRDVEDISRVLVDVPDWKALADWLNVRSTDIEANCPQDSTRASCCRRELVLRYCESQRSGNPSKVAEDIAQALEKMKYNLQAQQLRKTGLERRRFSGSSITDFIQQNWTGGLVAVMAIVISTCAVYCCTRGRENRGHEGRETKREHVGKEMKRGHEGREMKRGHEGREMKREHEGREMKRGHEGREMKREHIGKEMKRGHEEREMKTELETTRAPQPSEHASDHSGGQATVQSALSSQIAPQNSEHKMDLKSAIESQNVEEIEKLIAEGVDINQPFQDSFWTPLMEASSKGYTQVVELLLEEGANPNTENHLGRTPLIEASCKAHKDVVEMLLENGANPNRENFEGWTAIMEAAHKGHLDIVDLLLEHGAKPDMKDYTGWSGLLAAVHHGDEEVALRLIEAGAIPHLQSHSEGGTNAIFLAILREQPKVIKALLDHDPDLDIQNEYGETVLMTACMIGDLNLVQDLLKRKADPNIKNKNGDSPLLLATSQQNVEMVEALLKAGSNPNEGAVPPLHLAARMGGRDIVHLLLNYGANPALKDQHGATAYHVASSMNNTEVAQMISPVQSAESNSLEPIQNTLDDLTTLHTRLSEFPVNRTNAVQKAWNRRKEFAA